MEREKSMGRVDPYPWECKFGLPYLNEDPISAVNFCTHGQWGYNYKISIRVRV